MELKDLIVPLRRWWWLILLATLLAGGVSMLVVSQQPSVYRARSTLLIGSAINNPNPSGNDFWLSQQLADTYADIAQRQVIRDAVMETLGLPWLPGYTATTVPNTQLIEIAVTDTIPERAAVVANEITRQLILQTPTSAAEQGSQERLDFINRQLDSLETNIEETKAAIQLQQTELAALVSARQIADAQGQIFALEAKLDTLQSNYASLLASTSEGAVNSLSVIEPATVPQAPVGPEVLTSVLAAAAIGFSLAVGAAFLLEYLDDTIKSPDDVAGVVDIPTLAGIPHISSEFRDSKQMVAIAQPRSPETESFRALRTAVVFSHVDEPVRSVLVTSPGPSEGKSLTAANLAVVMAQAGNRVLLIDADLRRPTQHKAFGLSKASGLTELLVSFTGHTITDSSLGNVRFDNFISSTKQDDLFVMPSGAIPPNPAELVGSEKMKTIINFFSQRFDFVVVDGPPVLAVTDSVIMSKRVGTVLMIVRAGQTRRNQLTAAINKLLEVNADIAGVILNDLSAKSQRDYYYYNYSNKYYEQEPESQSGRSTGDPAYPNNAAEAKPGLFSRLRRQDSTQ